MDWKSWGWLQFLIYYILIIHPSIQPSISNTFWYNWFQWLATNLWPSQVLKHAPTLTPPINNFIINIALNFILSLVRFLLSPLDPSPPSLDPHLHVVVYFSLVRYRLQTLALLVYLPLQVHTLLLLIDYVRQDPRHLPPSVLIPIRSLVLVLVPHVPTSDPILLIDQGLLVCLELIACLSNTSVVHLPPPNPLDASDRPCRPVFQPPPLPPALSLRHRGSSLKARWWSKRTTRAVGGKPPSFSSTFRVLYPSPLLFFYSSSFPSPLSMSQKLILSLSLKILSPPLSNTQRSSFAGLASCQSEWINRS